MEPADRSDTVGDAEEGMNNALEKLKRPQVPEIRPSPPENPGPSPTGQWANISPGNSWALQPAEQGPGLPTSRPTAAQDAQPHRQLSCDPAMPTSRMEPGLGLPRPSS